MKMVDNDEILDKYDIFKAEKTFCLHLIIFNQNLDILKKLIKDKYDNSIFIPSAGKTTREIIKDLREYFDE